MLINCHSEPSKNKKPKQKPEEIPPLDDQQKYLNSKRINHDPNNITHGPKNRALRYFDSGYSKTGVSEILSARDSNTQGDGTSMMKSVQVNNFEEISERMKNSLSKTLELDFLTWIQKNSIPPIKSGRHTLIKSPSGTGKTLSYAIPIVDRLYESPKRITRVDGIHVLVIVPTKELAKQTCEVFSQVLSKFIWIQIGAVYGEDKRKSEKSRLRKGINILVCTPGRIYDHLINTYSLKLDNLKTLVIDEADMLLDLGYENKINQIIAELRHRAEIADFTKIQTILLSATLDQRVSKLSSGVLINPVFVDASLSNKISLAYEMLSCSSQLLQTVIIVPTKWRFVALIWFLFKTLQNSKSSKIIIFVGNIYSVRYLSAVLTEMFKAYSEQFKIFKLEIFQLHGSMEIKERMQIFNAYSKTASGLLLSTDVAARGLDFKNVEWVIQYDPARCPVDYVHRIGRTARAGNDGSSALFLSPHEIGYLNLLTESGMKISKQYDLNELSSEWLINRFGESSKLKKHAIEDEGSSIHLRLKKLVDESQDLMHLATKCFLASVKSYASYPRNLKQFFNPKALHTGHLANSLGLELTPKQISEYSRGNITSVKELNKKRKFSSFKSENLSFDDTKKRSKYKSALPSAISVSEFTSSLIKGPTTKNFKA